MGLMGMTRAYRLLLWLYPASFRAEYGEEMCAVLAARRTQERAAPTFALLAIGVAALGMGATTTAFTLLNHVVIRPLPFARADALVALYQANHARGQSRTRSRRPISRTGGR